MGSELPNVPLNASDEVDYDGSESDSDRKRPRRSETPVKHLKDEVDQMRAVMTTLIDQNNIMLEIIKSNRSASSDGPRPTYMKNVPKPVTWDTRDKRNIEAFLTEYEAYCDVSDYIGDEVRVRSFGSFLKEGASIAFAAWQASQGEDLPWATLKEWAVDVWRKPHQHLLDVTALGAMKWRNDQNLSCYAEDYKAKYLQLDCEKNPQLGLMGSFLTGLDENIRRKVWERETLHTTMMELLNLVNWLGDAQEISLPDIPNSKRSFEKAFGVGKHKFPKRRFESKDEGEGGSVGKPTTPKSYVKRAKQVDPKDATKKGLCFKCGKAYHMARECRVSGGGNVELNPTTIAPSER